MKVFLILAALVVGVHSLDEQLPITNYSAPANAPNESVFFYLYTKANPLIGQQITPSTIQSSNFNSRNPTRFVIHGWTSNYRDAMNEMVTSAWLSVGDFNVICVDWTWGRARDYSASVKAVPNVGRRIGETIKILHQNNGMSLETLQVIGHSLGGQVAGFVGKTVGAGQVGAIIGLDPAQPLFAYNTPDNRLSSTDGKFVEVLHTNGGQLGFLRPIGKRDFYINGGRKQPVCGQDRNGQCSHNLVFRQYSAAVRKGGTFNAVKCPNYERAVAKSCGTRSNKIVLGSSTSRELDQGIFYVSL